MNQVYIKKHHNFTRISLPNPDMVKQVEGLI